MNEHTEEITHHSENQEAQGDDTTLLIESFRKYRMAPLSSKVPNHTQKPVGDLNGSEILHICRVLEGNKGVRHQTAEDLECSISWLDQVIAFHKLEK